MENNLPPVPPQENNQETQHPKAPASKGTTPIKKKKLNARQILMIILVVLVIILPLSVYWVKDLQVAKLKVRQAVAMDSLKLQTNAMISESNQENLKTVAKVFSWVARGEIMRNNLEQLDLMMVELAKATGYSQVTIISEDGSVLISTDKTNEGITYQMHFYEKIAGSDETQINVLKNGDLLVSAPIFGIDKRLGSVVISSTPVNKSFTNTDPDKGSKKSE